MNRAVWLLYSLGTVCIGTALRRSGDLGDLLPLGAFIVLLAIGAVAVLVATHSAGADISGSPTRPVLVASLVGVPGLMLLPAETAWALAVAGALLVASWPVASRRWRGRVLVCVSTLIVGVAVAWMVDQVMLMRLGFEAAAGPLAVGLRLLGADAGAASDLVRVGTLKTDQGFKVDANTLGLGVHAIACVHLYLLRWVGARGVLGDGITWWRPLAGLGVALAVRFVLFVGLGVLLESASDYELTHFPYAGWFDWRCGLVIDGISAAVAVSVLGRGGAPATGPEPWSFTSRLPRWAIPCLAVLMGVGLAADRVFDCCGPRKSGRIAIDERHSRWESSDIRVGRDTYGSESGYNFRGIADWLATIHGPVRRIYEPLATGTLEGVDVLIIKTPTEEMAATEVAAVHEFVAAGGGLILIGDHTNVYGTSEILNRIAQPLGFHYQYDCLFDQRSRFEFHHTTEAHMQRHPILRDVPSILFEVGCSIQINSNRVRPILVGRGLKCQPIDFGVENFYPQPEDTADLRTGQFPVVVARNWGRGRVAAISDSTLFSTFSVFMPGRREIVEGMVEYVNHFDVGEGIRRLVRRLGWLCALVLCLALRGHGLALLCSVLFLALGSGHAAVGISERLIYPGNPGPRDPTSVNEVVFVRDQGGVDWGLTGFPKDADRCFDLFFQYTSRVGAFPRLVQDVGAALAHKAPIVLIDPVTGDDARTARDLVQCAEAGGVVIAMESRANACLDHLATELGLALTAPAPEETSLRLRTAHGAVEHRVPRPTCRSILGGSPLIVSERSGTAAEPSVRAVAVLVRHGKGSVVVITCGQAFSNSDYGFRYATIPDQSLRRLYETQYAIMAAAVGAGTDQEGQR